MSPTPPLLRMICPPLFDLVLDIGGLLGFYVLSSYKKSASASTVLESNLAFLEFKRAFTSCCDTFSLMVFMFNFGTGANYFLKPLGGRAPACILNCFVKFVLVGLIFEILGDRDAFLFLKSGLVYPRF